MDKLKELTQAELECIDEWLTCKDRVKAFDKVFSPTKRSKLVAMANDFFKRDDVKAKILSEIKGNSYEYNLELEEWRYRVTLLAEKARNDKDKLVALSLLADSMGFTSNLWTAIQVLKREGVELEYVNDQWVINRE